MSRDFSSCMYTSSLTSKYHPHTQANMEASRLTYGLLYLFVLFCNKCGASSVVSPQISNAQ